MKQMSDISYWEVLPAQKLNEAIQNLSIAEQHPIQDAVTGEILNNWKVTLVDGEPVDIPSVEYVLKQHKEAFHPIKEGMTLKGINDFDFSLWSTPTKASLAIYVGDATDGVKFGFKVTNTLNRTSSIHYRMRAYKKETSVQIIEKEHVLVWGFRQVCSNGMMMKIPLKTCKYLDAIQVTKLKNLFAQQSSIIHKGNAVNAKLEKIQYLVEGFLLLKGPLDMMIIDAKNYSITPAMARDFLVKYIGKRRLEMYLERFNMEEQTLWGLYNSITYIASHRENSSSSVRERVLEDASNLLTAELLAVTNGGH